MLLLFGSLRADAGREPLLFCLHHLVFPGTGPALGSAVAGRQGLPRGLLKLLAALPFFLQTSPLGHLF